GAELQAIIPMSRKDPVRDLSCEGRYEQ
ncbi:MAG: hypothetical protein JWO56_2441, partial [Acidobacteria bacterium]|nr:hypothetical protein [Acidobacteriota bacterium]